MNLELLQIDDRNQKEILESFCKHVYARVIFSSFDFRFGNAEITIQGNEIGLVSLCNVSEDCNKINIIFNPTRIETVGKTLHIHAKIDIYNQSDLIG